MSFDRLWHGRLRRPYRLHTASYGDSKNPVIILIHGIAASGEYWNKFIPLLTPQYYCITIDLLGFGESPKPQWAAYDIDQHIRSIRSSITSLRLHRPYILAGHSLGSLLATRFASRYPLQVKQLLLLSPPVYPPADTIQGKLALKRTDLLMRTYRYLRSSPRMTGENIARLGKLGVLPPTIAKHPDTWVPFKRSLEHCIEQQSILRDIQDIAIPVDLFYGTLDAVLVGENVRRLADIPHVRMHTFRGSHQLSEKYAKVVVHVLAAQPAETDTSAI